MTQPNYTIEVIESAPFGQNAFVLWHEGRTDAIVFDPDSGDFAGKTFLVVDANGVAGYQAGQDLVFELDHASHLNHLKASSFT